MSDPYPNGARVARGLQLQKLKDGPPRVRYTIETDGTEFEVTAAFAMNPFQKERVVDARIETLEAQLKASQSRIEELEAKIDRPCASDSLSITNLKTKHAAARKKLDEIIAAGAEKWELYKADLWIAWNELETAFQDFQQSALTEKRNRLKNDGHSKEQ